MYFAPPQNDGGSPVTSYRINRTIVCKCPQVIDNHSQPTTATYVDTSVGAGHTYRYTVFASNASGESTASATLVVAIPTTSRTDYVEVPVGRRASVTRQYQDLLGHHPTAIELGKTTAILTTHPEVADQFIDGLATDASRSTRAQVIRLYFAYFNRPPDHGGLAYWTAQIGEGKHDINDVSNNFASSHEFKTTYGQLSNSDFVTLVYLNVLEPPRTRPA